MTLSFCSTVPTCERRAASASLPDGTTKDAGVVILHFHASVQASSFHVPLEVWPALHREACRCDEWIRS